MTVNKRGSRGVSYAYHYDGVQINYWYALIRIIQLSPPYVNLVKILSFSGYSGISLKQTWTTLCGEHHYGWNFFEPMVSILEKFYCKFSCDSYKKRSCVF